MSLKRNIISGFKFELAGRFLHLAASGLLIVLLARLLGAEQYGVLFLAISILSIGTLISNLGIHRAAARYINEYEETDQSQVPHIIKYSITLIIIPLSITCTVLLISHNQISNILNEPNLSILLQFGILYIVFSCCMEFCRRSVQGFKNVEKSALISAINAVVRFFAAILFVLIGYGVIGALFGYIFGFLVASTFGVLVLKKNYNQYAAASSMEGGLRRRIFEYSLPLTLTSSGDILIKRADVLLIGYFLTPVYVGYYTVAKQLIQFVDKPAASLGFSVAPRYAEQILNDNVEAASSIYQESLSNILLIYIPATAGLIIVAEPTIRIFFGEEYISAVPVIQVFAIYLLSQVITYITSSGLDYLGKAKLRGYAKIGVATGNVILNIILIPYIGIVGAAIATAISYVLYSIINVYIINSLMDIDWTHIANHAMKVLVVTSAMSVPVFILSNSINSIVSLISVVSVGVLVWCGGSLLLGLVSLSDVRYLAKSIS